MTNKNIKVSGSEILILGITFKENCPDLRNSLVINLIKKLDKYNMKITIVDPLVDTKLAFHKHKLKILKDIPRNNKYDTLITAVGHSFFKKVDSLTWSKLIKDNGFFLDLKGLIPRELEPIRIM